MHTHTITLGTLPGQQDLIYLGSRDQGAKDSRAFALEDYPDGIIIEVPKRIRYTMPGYYIGLLQTYLRDEQFIGACMKRVALHGDSSHTQPLVLAMQHIVLDNTRPYMYTPAPPQTYPAFMHILPWFANRRITS